MDTFSFTRHIRTNWSRALLAVAPLLAGVACNDADSPPTDEGVTQVRSAITDPVATCNQDPRVNSGLVPLNVCAGARVFFDETFNGNGRTCGSCHPSGNNFTIDGNFVASLPPTDKLFVAETNPDLAGLETASLHMPDALIKENVDGTDDLAHKFVSRAVSHTLSLATSITRDPADGTSALVPQRTGWGGDGAPDGTLRTFVDGAIRQHFTQKLDRVVGRDFRLPTDTERDEILAFQLALGRTADINLAQVTFTDSQAAAGKTAFMDPMVGRCNECHSNAGANARASGKNRNFNTGTVTAPAIELAALGTFADGRFLLDGGFGTGNPGTPPTPDFSTGLQGPANDAFGNGTFNTPPLIEAADTAPFFHQHGFGTANDPTANMESGVAFYATSLFLNSPAAKELDQQFGAPVNVGPSVGTISRFLRVLNVSFNLAMAKQRLDASRTLNIQYWGYRDDIQKGLLKLANKEIDDARRVLTNGGADLHPAQQTSLANAQTLLSQAIAATDPAVRKARTESAITIVQTAKNALGTNMNFQLGTGNLMF